MEIHIHSNTLAHEVALAKNVSVRRATTIHLNDILLEANEEGLTLTSTDLEVGYQASVTEGVEVVKTGAFAVDGHLLDEVVSAFGKRDAEVSLRLEEDGHLVCECGGDRFRLPTASAEDYPRPATVESRVEVVLPLKVLQPAMKQSLVAASTAEQRYAIRGVLWVLHERGLRLVSTDSHRLSLIELEAPPTAENNEMIVPRKAMEMLQRLGENEEEVKVGVGVQGVSMVVGGRTLLCRPLEVNFPNYEGVLPKDYPHEAVFKREAILDALRVVVRVADPKMRTVQLSLQNEDQGACEILAEHRELGSEGRVAVSLEEFHGEPMAIGFNGQYLIDYLGCLTGESVVLQYRDKEAQVQWLPHGDLGEGVREHRYVVMPMRT